MLGGADNPNGELPSYITGADTIFVFDQHSWHDRTSINGLRSVMLMNHKNSCP
ncbi:hypothetical protein ACPB0Q_23385 [Escherichia coli]